MPTYETRLHREVQRRAVIQIVHWLSRYYETDYGYSKLGPYSRPDYLIFSLDEDAPQNEYLIEIKGRNCQSGAYEDYCVEQVKVENLLLVGDLLGLIPVLGVRYKDKLVVKEITEADLADIRMGGRKDRGEPPRPMAHIPHEGFIEVPE